MTSRWKVASLTSTTVTGPPPFVVPFDGASADEGADDVGADDGAACGRAARASSGTAPANLGE
jgi:hypothetical protein